LRRVAEELDRLADDVTAGEADSRDPEMLQQAGAQPTSPDEISGLSVEA
jgi:hypothetical protein